MRWVYPNKSLRAQTIGGLTTRFGWDDADRLYSQTFPDGHSDTYTYTGLGMRLRKNDPTGNYWYDADGVSPASPVLSDGYSTFTPGISEINGSGSRFYLADAQGNSRGLLDGNQGNTDGYNWDAFGNSVSRGGTNPTAFAWNEESGYQSDGDSGLKLLGHRYYDSRTGRFLSQDPAGNGDNWYGYCGNDPMNEADPEGLVSQSVNGGSASLGGPMALAADLANFDAGFGFTVTAYTHDWTEIHNGSLDWVHEPGSDTYSQQATTFGPADLNFDFGIIPPFDRMMENCAVHLLADLGRAALNIAGVRTPSGGGNQQEIHKVPDLTGKPRIEVDQVLKGRGFNYKGRTPGGYEKYYHPDGGKIQIRPDGEVVRYGPRGLRVDQNGKTTSSHNTGEIVGE